MLNNSKKYPIFVMLLIVFLPMSACALNCWCPYPSVPVQNSTAQPDTMLFTRPYTDCPHRWSVKVPKIGIPTDIVGIWSETSPKIASIFRIQQIFWSKLLLLYFWNSKWPSFIYFVPILDVQTTMTRNRIFRSFSFLDVHVLDRTIWNWLGTVRQFFQQIYPSLLIAESDHPDSRTENVRKLAILKAKKSPKEHQSWPNETQLTSLFTETNNNSDKIRSVRLPAKELDHA